MSIAPSPIDALIPLMGDKASWLLDHECRTVSKDRLHLPGPDFVSRVVADSDRSPRVMKNLQSMLNHGRLGGTGYLSILPVDQGIEHSAGASFAPNPAYFDPANIVRLAIDAGCSAVVSTLGVLGSVARLYAHRIPFIVKMNHNELMTYPNKFDQVAFASVRQAFDMGCVAIGATVYYGSDESSRQITEVSSMFQEAHELGMATILWTYLRNPAFKVDGKDYHTSADLTGQANHLGVTIEADIIKQKQPELNRGFEVLNKNGAYGKFDPRMYDELSSDHPIDMTRYQIVNSYMGRIPVINSGGPASGDNDLEDAVITSVINKRAGGIGLICGRKAFQRPMTEGIELINAIQDVYLCDAITIA